MDCMDFRWIGKFIRQKCHLPLDAKVIDANLMVDDDDDEFLRPFRPKYAYAGPRYMYSEFPHGGPGSFYSPLQTSPSVLTPYPCSRKRR